MEAGGAPYLQLTEAASELLIEGPVYAGVLLKGGHLQRVQLCRLPAAPIPYLFSTPNTAFLIFHPNVVFNILHSRKQF